MKKSTIFTLRVSTRTPQTNGPLARCYVLKAMCFRRILDSAAD